MMKMMNPTVQIPSCEDHPTAHIHSPSYDAVFSALQRYLPSNTKDDAVSYSDSDDYDIPVDAFSCDDFRMYEFKVKKCARARSHDWTECPFAHPGEKARRRDPRRHHYSGSACPDFRRGGACRMGDACELAHGVFESWLHPARYRTQPCKDGARCRRRVCFFAHTPDQLRVLSPGSLTGPSPPLSPPYGSPPVSPSLSQLTESIRGMQIGGNLKMGFASGMSPPSWGAGFGSPRSPLMVRPGFAGSPPALVRSIARPFDAWEGSCEEEPMMERVESGRKLREQIYAKIGRENSLGRGGAESEPGPDVGWVSELVK